MENMKKMLALFTIASLLLALSMTGCKKTDAPDDAPQDPPVMGEDASGINDPGQDEDGTEFGVDPGNTGSLLGQDGADGSGALTAFAAAARDLGVELNDVDGLETAWSASGDGWSCDAKCVSGPGAEAAYDLAWAEIAYADGAMLVSGDPAEHGAVYMSSGVYGTEVRHMYLYGDTAYLFTGTYEGNDVPDGLGEQAGIFTGALAACLDGREG